jgi:hypothetical protein
MSIGWLPAISEASLFDIACTACDNRAMKWKQLRNILLWICRLIVPISVLIGMDVILSIGGPGYDVWTWAAIGAFNGIVYGGLIALTVRFGIFIIDKFTRSN